MAKRMREGWREFQRQCQKTSSVCTAKGPRPLPLSTRPSAPWIDFSTAEWLIFSSNGLVGRAFILSEKGVVEMTRRGSAVIKRSIARDGHRSSVSLENEFWDALRESADSKNMTVSDVVATLDRGGNRNNLSSAIRVFVLDHYRRSSEHTPAGQPSQTPLPQRQTHLKVP